MLALIVIFNHFADEFRKINVLYFQSSSRVTYLQQPCTIGALTFAPPFYLRYHLSVFRQCKFSGDLEDFNLKFKKV